MTLIQIKRVYEAPSPDDGWRVLVDKLWPRGIRKEALPYDLWAKKLAPSAPLRIWFHEDPAGRWAAFERRYTAELEHSPAIEEFLEQIHGQARVTLLYASKNAAENHALILRRFLMQRLSGR